MKNNIIPKDLQQMIVDNFPSNTAVREMMLEEDIRGLVTFFEGEMHYLPGKHKRPHHNKVIKNKLKEILTQQRAGNKT